MIDLIDPMAKDSEQILAKLGFRKWKCGIIFTWQDGSEYFRSLGVYKSKKEAQSMLDSVNYYRHTK
jgi:hypothetical protein